MADVDNIQSPEKAEVSLFVLEIIYCFSLFGTYIMLYSYFIWLMCVDYF